MVPLIWENVTYVWALRDAVTTNVLANTTTTHIVNISFLFIIIMILLSDIYNKKFLFLIWFKSIFFSISQLSELLKGGYEHYEIANSKEKARIIRLIFSELSLSENTLTYKCNEGFEALQKRLDPLCAGG